MCFVLGLKFSELLSVMAAMLSCPIWLGLGGVMPNPSRSLLRYTISLAASSRASQLLDCTLHPDRRWWRVILYIPDVLCIPYIRVVPPGMGRRPPACWREPGPGCARLFSPRRGRERSHRAAPKAPRKLVELTISCLLSGLHSRSVNGKRTLAPIS